MKHLSSNIKNMFPESASHITDDLEKVSWLSANSFNVFGLDIIFAISEI